MAEAGRVALLTSHGVSLGFNARKEPLLAGRIAYPAGPDLR
jgi:hypothetical protein